MLRTSLISISSSSSSSSTLLKLNPCSYHLRHHNHHPFRRRIILMATRSTATATEALDISVINGDHPPYPTSNKSKRRKAERESPLGLLRRGLDMCSKQGDVVTAIRLYDEALSSSLSLSQQHFNSLLYLCSLQNHSTPENGTGGDGFSKDEILRRGFEIYERMVKEDVPRNEATFTNLTRLAAAKGDFGFAFEVVKSMKGSGVVARLRSFGPALFGFCENGEAEKAYEVDEYMAETGILPEEPELAALLKVSSCNGKGDKVYEMLHRLRKAVRGVLEATLEVVEGWFRSEKAAEFGKEDWDEEEIKKAVVRGGGGWHGTGWLGKGEWKVERTKVRGDGVCEECGEKLALIDIDPVETRNFATSVAELACQREARADFIRFQEWLERHGPYDAVIDGANVGMFSDGNFNFHELTKVVNGIRDLSKSKKSPLVILHTRRVGDLLRNPKNKRVIESWQKSHALYATPLGSNDDWYWLYAAVSCRSLLVTNDEMRDHLFELLGNSFFPRWKERHQVRMTQARSGVTFHMPPPYSIVIQESERGSWHIPTVIGDDIESPRVWLCATRPAFVRSSKVNGHVEQREEGIARSSSPALSSIFTL